MKNTNRTGRKQALIGVALLLLGVSGRAQAADGETDVRHPEAVAAILLTGVCSARGGTPAYDASSDISRLRSEGGLVFDSSGRVVLLRGANVPAHCYKPNKFGEADLDALQSFGFNFIRLGISWDKAEPVEGEIDLDYIRSLVEFARSTGERGMYVMPEVHKYGWCQPGSDWPAWTCIEPVADGNDTAAMLKNARHFWNSPGLQDKLIAFWRILVAEFRDLDNVMGYNPMNEPLDITMMAPGLFDRTLFAFYEKWIKAVRELDPDRIACLEPSTVNMIIPMLPPPFRHENLIYAPHPYYVHGGDFVLPETTQVLKMKYRRIAREAEGLNAALLVGEYGGDPETRFARRWLTTSWDLQDQYFAGAAIWVYNNENSGWAIVDQNRVPKPFFARALRRPYPRYTAGMPLELGYRWEEGDFIYRFMPDHYISAPTVLFIPAGLARGRVSVTGGSWIYYENAEVMTVTAEPGSIEVSIRIERNPD